MVLIISELSFLERITVVLYVIKLYRGQKKIAPQGHENFFYVIDVKTGLDIRPFIFYCLQILDFFHEYCNHN